MARTPAQSLYPHLPSADRAPSTQRERSLADAMYPSLSREARAKEAELAWVEARNKRNRDNTLKWLREANANLRADKAGRC